MKYILSVEDDWSRFVDLIPIPAKDAGSVASGLMDKFISRFGLPGELYSDQGKRILQPSILGTKQPGKVSP